MKTGSRNEKNQWKVIFLENRIRRGEEMKIEEEKKLKEELIGLIHIIRAPKKKE